MNLSKILKSIKYEILFGETDINVEGVSCNSKRCAHNYIFVAIIGESADGHLYIRDAVNNGAKVVFYQSKRGIDLSEFHDENITFVKVENTRDIYSTLSAMFYDFPTEKVNLIGVTGTNGKTTITFILEKLLPNSGVIGTINYRFKENIFEAPNTTPEPCEINYYADKFLKMGAKNIIMEVSSHGIEMGRVKGLGFDIGIFTNLTWDHIDFHKNFENYFEAKKKFFTDIIPQSNSINKVAIINIDDDFGRKIYDLVTYNKISFSLNDNRADIYPLKYKTSINGSSIKVKIYDKEFDINSNLVGEYNIMNILAALAVAKFMKITEESILNTFNSPINVPGRLERVSFDRNIFIDYAHTEDALKNVLETLAKLKKDSKLITVFGCGGDRDKSKRSKMGYIASKLSDFVIVTSDNPRSEDPLAIIDNILEGVKVAVGEDLIKESCYRVIPDRLDAIRMAVKLADKKDIVVIAGKGHEDYQIIGKEKFPFSDKKSVEDILKR